MSIIHQIDLGPSSQAITEILKDKTNSCTPPPPQLETEGLYIQSRFSKICQSFYSLETKDLVHKTLGIVYCKSLLNATYGVFVKTKLLYFS